MEEEWMKEALRLAEKAASEDETPIGCVIEYQGKIIGKGYNKRNQMGNPLAHAEIEAINEAAHYMGDWRLEDCTLYVTLEPCPMCAGAIIQARIPRVVMGAMNPKAGCAGSIIDLFHQEKFNHKVESVSGVMEEESRALLQDFFGKMRKRDENPPKPARVDTKG
ncbi:MAG: tRNA adenosine(34) deaminase TadA [Firmicutes bacterium]|nr:tRNA adenosine(34) deaminase TadA [Bacillota bacterium]